MRSPDRKTLLDRNRAPWLPILLGVLVMLPSLWAGLVMDDVLIRARLLHADSAWGPSPWWDLYTFAREDLNPALRDAGLHPWWADPSVKMVFFRPFSALTHVLDYALWPDAPAIQHLHSVLWYALCVAAAGAVLRRLHPESPETAALATLIFAVAAPHATTVAWVAARNTLICFVLSFAVLALHIRGREDARPALKRAAVALFGVGLLAGEAMLGGFFWLLAWQLCLDRGPWRRRLGPLLPYALLITIWRWSYVHGGFGATASGIYFDSSSDLPGALRAALENLPVLLMSRWLLVPLDAWAVVPAWVHRALQVLSLVSLPALAALLAAPLRQSPRARFWALGLVGSLLPFTATMPMDRLLLIAGPGWAALLAGMALAPTGRRRVVTALLVLHLPISALFGIVRGINMPQSISVFDNGLEQAPRDAAVPEQTFVYVTSTFHRVHYTTLMRLCAGDPAVPRRSVVLSSFLSDAEVTRTDTRTLEIAPTGGFMDYDLDRIHRAAPRALPVGAVVSLPDLDVEILALTEDGRPARAAFRFHVPLEDPSLRWLAVEPVGAATFPPQVETRAFPLPAIGETVRVEAAMRLVPG